jgi:hypothetical protein
MYCVLRATIPVDTLFLKNFFLIHALSYIHSTLSSCYYQLSFFHLKCKQDDTSEYATIVKNNNNNIYGAFNVNLHLSNSKEFIKFLFLFFYLWLDVHSSGSSESSEGENLYHGTSPSAWKNKK